MASNWSASRAYPEPGSETSRKSRNESEVSFIDQKAESLETLKQYPNKGLDITLLNNFQPAAARFPVLMDCFSADIDKPLEGRGDVLKNKHAKDGAPRSNTASKIQ